LPSIVSTDKLMVRLMVRHRLTDAKIKGLSDPGMFGDGAGLYLRVHSGGSKSWFFVYQRNRIRRELGLGGFAGTAPVSLALARKKADDLRQALADGRDPFAERAARKASHSTFGDVADRFIKDKSDWTTKTEKEWRHHLKVHSLTLRNVAVDAVNLELVESVLRPLWQKRPATGQRVRGKIEAVLDYATAKRLRMGDNPARWSGHLEHVLTSAGRVTGAHHAALPYRDVPALIAALGDTVEDRCLRLTILTAVRSGEARLADWSEFDLDTKVWNIPGERTKTRKPLAVPLSDTAIAVLGEAKEGFVFEGARKGRPFGHAAMGDALELLAQGFTVHGFRSAFRDWVGEETDYPSEIAEWSLGHKVGSAVERAYRRGDALEKRRALMADWAAFCVKMPQT
jgi:integrase